MTKGDRRRAYGDKTNFKSLSCAPLNELGVVYLFGVLHETSDFRIESIQAGFPDCIARHKVGKNRWEEVRIEFEYDSKSFVAHNHDPMNVDVIVRWIHNWKECPKRVEVVKLSSLLGTGANRQPNQDKTRHNRVAKILPGETAGRDGLR